MKKKKGFTLVELLVVIAILAVLATVSVVGYMGFTKKAQVSNDTSLVSQLNTLLKANEAINGKAKTPTDALKVTEESGYNVEKLTPTTDKYNIVWNQEENQFALLDEKDSPVYGIISENTYMNWKFVDSYTVASDFSIYLMGNKITSIPEEIKTGLDVGNNKIVLINYKNNNGKQNTVIRTNGGKLNVEANEDTISHYGMIEKLNVFKVATSDCYHEFGYVETIENFGIGKFVAEKGAKFHQTKAEVENVLNNNTFELSNATFESHYYDEDGVCVKKDSFDPEVHTHNWSEYTITKEATDTECGEKVRTCSTCTITETAIIEARGHDIVHHEAKAPTCTEKGWGSYDTCTRCDYTTYNEIPALNHDLVHHEAKEETCTAVGWNEYDTCTRCDYTTYVEIPSKGHTPVVDEAVEATCITTGLTKGQHCSACGNIIVAQEVVPAKGHTIVVDKAIEATCTKTGLTEGKHCAVCNKVIVAQEETPIIDHEAGEGDKCIYCGTILPNNQFDTSAIVVTTYEDLKARLESTGTSEGSEMSQLTVRLAANIAAPKDGNITQNNKLEVTLDLHGYTLTLFNSVDNGTNYNGSGFFVQGAMTIKDSSIAGCGKIVAAENDNVGTGGLITVQKTSNTVLFGSSNNQFVLQSGTIDATNNPNGSAIVMYHSGSITINGGKVIAEKYAISGSTNEAKGGFKYSRLIINNGTIISTKSYAIYHPQYFYYDSSDKTSSSTKNGCFTITNGNIFGEKGAIYIGGNTQTETGSNSGSRIYITGGNLSSNGESIIYINTTFLKNKSSVDVCIDIKIEGGVFSNSNTCKLVIAKMDKATKSSNSGGTFNTGSNGVRCYLAGGVYKNISQDKCVYFEDFKNDTQTTPTTNYKTASKCLSNGYVVNGNNNMWSIVTKTA